VKNRALLARLNEYNLEPETFSIDTKALNEPLSVVQLPSRAKDRPDRRSARAGISSAQGKWPVSKSKRKMAVYKPF